MTEDQPQLSLQQMIDRGPQWLNEYLRLFEEGKPAAPPMIGIEAGAMSRARTESSLEWADIAVRAAALRSLENGGEHRDSALTKAMELRAWFIGRMGVRSGHPVLDRDVILRWFDDEAKLPPDAVREMAARWKHATGLSREELLSLRNLKHRIDVLRALERCGALPDEERWKKWLAVRDLIP